MLARILRIVGLVLALLMLYFIAFLANLPLNNILEKNIDQLNAQLTPYSISFKTAESGLTGLTFTGVEISSTIEAKKSLAFNQIHIPFFTLSFFQGGLPFEAEIYRGSVNGTYFFFSKKVFVAIDNVSVGESNILRELQLFNNSPTLSGEVNLNLSGDYISTNFNISTVSINGKSPTFKLPLDILPPAINFSKLTGEFTMENQAKISLSLDMEGDYTGKVAGQIIWNAPNIPSSVLNLSLRGSFSEDFAGENKDIFLFGGEFLNGRQANLSITGKVSSPLVKKL